MVAPGTLFSIVVDVTPRPGMHVYAPGTHSYKVIALRLDAQPLLLARPLQYPASEIYVFKPLNERVEVFQKPFRLVQDVALSASPDARKALSSVEDAVDHRHTGIPGVRRHGVLPLQVGAGDVHRERAAARFGTGERLETVVGQRRSRL